MPERICSIEGCERPHVARGWCYSHYQRWTKHGDPMHGGALRRYVANDGAACAVDGCENPSRTRGWCDKHYNRWLTHGDPCAPFVITPGMPLEERFWAKVDKDGALPAYAPFLGPCWIWTARGDRYGRVRDGSAARQAHVVSYELLVGPIPGDVEPDHLCRVGFCVKAVADEHGPAHLELVTHRENVLRGEGPTAINAAKTHCVHGHEFTPANTMPRSDGGRKCRTCHRAAGQRHRLKRAV